jgi:hypothetical protein
LDALCDARDWPRERQPAPTARQFTFGALAKWWRKNLEPAGMREAAPHDMVELKMGN